MNTHLCILSILVGVVAAGYWEDHVTPEKEAEIRAISQLASQWLDIYKPYMSSSGLYAKVIKVIHPYPPKIKEQREYDKVNGIIAKYLFFAAIINSKLTPEEEVYKKIVRRMFAFIVEHPHLHTKLNKRKKAKLRERRPNVVHKIAFPPEKTVSKRQNFIQ